MMTMCLQTYDGARYQLPTLVRWDLTYTGSVPCDSMTATCLYDESMADVLPRATRFTAYRDGEIVLRGVVDAYEISLSRQGLLAVVEGRGMAALLLDNESEALSYERAVLSEILGNHVSPYGIQVNAQQNVSGNNYAVASGSSQWKALQGFTHRFGGFDPYFTREGTLTVQPLWGSGKKLAVNDNTPLLSLRKREQRYGVISEVLIQDKVQGISHSVQNQAFAKTGGQRRHVLYMPRSTADDRRYTGEYQIAQSALEQLEIMLELPFSFAAFPGDRIGLSLNRLKLHGTYDVTAARSRMDGDGERTEVTLSRR
ncbi:MAG: hypothetical protein K2N78_00090 [Oscillospiraceae bacterium]|nr:hypothetical protein [Oscillospiraceae bacterium]